MAGTDYNLKLVIDAQNNATKEIDKISSQVSGIGKTIGKLGISAVAIKGVKDFASSALELGGNLEQAEVAFTTMLGSADEADKMLKDLSDFAKKTPFELTGIRDSAKQMLAMGIEADSLLPTLKSLGDVSAGLGVDLSRLAYNFGQVKSQGKLTGTELRDFTKMGIPLVNELAKTLGKTEIQVQDMVSAGEIGFDLVEQAFTDMTSAGGKFEDLMTKQSGTYQGMMSNLNDSLDSIKETLGRTFLPVLEKIVGFIGNVVQKISDRTEANPELATTLATVVAGAIALVGAFSGISAILPIISAGITALTGPIGLVIAGITALGVARANNRGGIRDTVNETIEEIKPYLEEFIAWRDEFRGEYGPYIVDGVQAVLDLLKDIIGVAFELIGNAVKTAVEGILLIVDIFSGNRDSARERVKKIGEIQGDSIKKIITGVFQTTRDDVTQKCENFINYFQRLREKIKNIMSSIGESVSGAISTATDKVSTRYSNAKKAIKGEKAIGGPVMGGSTYLVGENGPELFTAPSNGRIINNSDLEGAGGNISINLNMGGVVINDGTDEETFAENIVNRITRELQLQKRAIYI